MRALGPFIFIEFIDNIMSNSFIKNCKATILTEKVNFDNISLKVVVNLLGNVK